MIVFEEFCLGLRNSGFWLLLFTLLSSVSHASQNELDEHVVILPLEIVRGDLLLKVQLIDRPDIRMVLDTGASTNIIIAHPGTENLNLPVSGTARVLMPLLERYASGQIIEPVDLKLKANVISLSGGLLLDWRESGLFRSSADIYYDGIIGRDFFDNHAVLMDVSEKRAVLFPSGTSVRDYDQPVAIAFIEELPIIELVIEMDGQPLRKRMLVDTGYPGSLTLHGLSDDEISRLTARYGPHQDGGRRVNVAFGACSRNEVRMVAFREPFFELDEIDGVIGMDFLARKAFVIDYQRQSLSFKKRDCD